MNKKQIQIREAELQTLKNLKSFEEITSLKLIRQFEDDHRQCADVKVNGIKVAFYYHDDLGFLTYLHDSLTAKKHFWEAFKNAIEIEEMNLDDERE